MTMGGEDEKVRKPKQCPICGGTTFIIFDDYVECANQTCGTHVVVSITGTLTW